MKKKIYIVTDKKGIIQASYDLLPWNMFSRKKDAKRYLKRTEHTYYNEPFVCKITLEKMK